MLKHSNEPHSVGGGAFEGIAACRSALASARTFASREVFSPTHMSPEKMIEPLFAPAGANSARLFYNLMPLCLTQRGFAFIICHALHPVPHGTY